MPRMDDYLRAVELAKKEIQGKTPDLLCRISGAEMERDKQGRTWLTLIFLNQKVLISWPELVFSSKDSGEEWSIQQRILLLHYLKGLSSSSAATFTGEWIAFQDVPDGKFYLDAFERRAKIPLVQSFGHCPDLLVSLAADAFAASPFTQGDCSVLVRVLPLVPVALILWKGDDEFPPAGNILFDRNVTRIFTAEDIAWLAGMVVYPLIGAAKKSGNIA